MLMIFFFKKKKKKKLVFGSVGRGASVLDGVLLLP